MEDEIYHDLPLMSIADQLRITDEYLQQYLRQQTQIDSNVTLWFKSILESLHRLESLMK